MRTSFGLAAVALFAATPALADQPGADWISRAKVENILRHRGYAVTKLEADDAHWEGEATRDGKRFEFHVDPRNGTITKLEPDRD